MSYAKLLTIMWTMVLLLAASFALAEVPQTINYQGRLTGTDGNPVDDGDYNMVFTIYNSEAAPSGIWYSGIQSVHVENGQFSYLLGSVNPLQGTLFNDTLRWLGIKVGADPEILPRVRMISAPYAYQALRSDSAAYAALADHAVTSDNTVLADDATLLQGQPGAYYLAWNNLTGVPAGFADGVDDVGTGDITAVNSGTGLSGGGTTGDVTLWVAPDGITATHIATNAVGASEIATGAVGYSEIATNAVGSSKIIDESITTADIQNGSVYSPDIANETILGIDISTSANIETSKISGTAVNLSSTQTITGTKTFDGTVYFGDSAMTVNGYSIRMGDNSSPSSSSVLHIARDYNSTSNRYGLFTSLKNNSTSSEQYPTYGIYSQVYSANDYQGTRTAVYGYAGNDAYIHGSCYGVRGSGLGGNYAYGLYGYGRYSDNQDYGIYATCGVSNGNWGAYFTGNSRTTGSWSKGGGYFIIDHPQDPENMYLSHNDVSSPEMMNIYNGNIELDANGEAVVELPKYFESLNNNFRYQLTPIGASMPDIFVAQEIDGNRFSISGGKPFMKVSWMVTGLRKDAFANDMRKSVEEYKSEEERGLYMHPEVFGFDMEKSINKIHHQDLENHAESSEE